ncbi:hypothetical protein EW026_g4400 [Hermanssonia centrifuga]|uniref:Uncharacterized protein n=1 Tax=Hermanssonia centrifuga TaxID=98765 RepID=A0A4S4KIC3_9APHY|nr:hypothetical protein EW026_g4400 [Hermanssonia centrifuga]
MSAAPEDLSYIHRRCVLVDKLVSLEWAHLPYDTEGRYNLPLISVRMHRLRDLAEEVYADLEAHPEVPRTPAPCLPFDLSTMELLAHIRAAALPSGPVIDIEDTPPVSPIEDDVPLALEAEIGSHADALMRIAREIRDMHQNTVIAIRSMHEDVSISKLDLGVLVRTCDRNLALARAHTTHLGKIQGVVHDVAGGVDMLQGAVHDLGNSERRVRELEGRLRGSARENEQLREERGRAHQGEPQWLCV